MTPGDAVSAAMHAPMPAGALWWVSEPGSSGSSEPPRTLADAAVRRQGAAAAQATAAADIALEGHAPAADDAPKDGLLSPAALAALDAALRAARAAEAARRDEARRLARENAAALAEFGASAASMAMADAPPSGDVGQIDERAVITPPPPLLQSFDSSARSVVGGAPPPLPPPIEAIDFSAPPPPLPPAESAINWVAAQLGPTAVRLAPSLDAALTWPAKTTDTADHRRRLRDDRAEVRLIVGATALALHRARESLTDPAMAASRSGLGISQASFHAAAVASSAGSSSGVGRGRKGGGRGRGRDALSLGRSSSSLGLGISPAAPPMALPPTSSHGGGAWGGDPAQPQLLQAQAQRAVGKVKLRMSGSGGGIPQAGTAPALGSSAVSEASVPPAPPPRALKIRMSMSGLGGPPTEGPLALGPPLLRLHSLDQPPQQQAPAQQRAPVAQRQAPTQQPAVLPLFEDYGTVGAGDDAASDAYYALHASGIGGGGGGDGPVVADELGEGADAVGGAADEDLLGGLDDAAFDPLRGLDVDMDGLEAANAAAAAAAVTRPHQAAGPGLPVAEEESWQDAADDLGFDLDGGGLMDIDEL